MITHGDQLNFPSSHHLNLARANWLRCWPAAHFTPSRGQSSDVGPAVPQCHQLSVVGLSVARPVSSGIDTVAARTWICKDPTGLKLDPVLVLVAAAPSAHTAAAASSRGAPCTGGHWRSLRSSSVAGLASGCGWRLAAGGWRLAAGGWGHRATRNKRQPLLTPRARPQAASGFFSGCPCPCPCPGPPCCPRNL